MLRNVDIGKILPQRYPILMIDRVLELEPGKKIVALKNVSMNEPFFPGHFPGNPIMPGVMMVEAMAQASIILFSAHTQGDASSKTHYYLGSVKMRFLHPVVPGDQLKIFIEPVKIISTAGIVKAQAFVAEKEVACGELSFMAT
jgi:3-hydroxyacyl-[acyl-carrier-protein] dehydratase